MTVVKETGADANILGYILQHNLATERTTTPLMKMDYVFQESFRHYIEMSGGKVCCVVGAQLLHVSPSKASVTRCRKNLGKIVEI
mmetsp:Transcript_25881/g.53961  ORF Transcript_25881/g.53961 Transcript_25881/m.53961 type:complete len:85 (+) Transcript_25881:236-490(+)